MSHSEPLISLQGVVVAGMKEAPLEGVLVEVFDHPEIAMKEPSILRKGKQKRLAACITGKSGLFSFDAEPGRYELRLSKPIEWDCKSILVKLTKTATRKKILRVQMELSN